jgi:Peptidase S24-like
MCLDNAFPFIDRMTPRWEEYEVFHPSDEDKGVARVGRSGVVPRQIAVAKAGAKVSHLGHKNNSVARVGNRRPAKADILPQVILNPQAVKMVLDNGHPVEVEVAGESMTPTLERGTKVKVESVAGELRPGDIVLIMTSCKGELVLHRVMHLFAEGGQRYVIHQGDAPRSDFATCPREAIVGRAVGFPLAPARLLPTLDVLDRAALARFHRRRRVSLLYSLCRRARFWLRLSDYGPARRGVSRLARIYRALTSKAIG